MRNLYLISLLMLCITGAYAQESLKALSDSPKDAEGRYPFWRCATVEVNSVLKSRYPDMPSDDEFENFIKKASAHRRQFRMQQLEDRIFVIPVVVHVIHNGESVGVGSNISLAQIQSQIEVLNEDFRRKPGTRGFNDHPDAADSRIEFVLAEVGPDGTRLTEPGVHRVRNTSVGVSGSLDPYLMDAYVKPATYWDPTRYLNMWTANLSGGLLGYAQFPISSGLDGLDLQGMETAAETDGVVMKYTTFGSSEKGNFALEAPYNFGRVTTHEVGHWLGLRHIWGDGGCGVDDYCEDTPLAEGPNYNCSGSHFSCGSEDMTQNYMDYSTDPCMSMFTKDQKERFMTVLEYSPRRKELLTSKVLARADFTSSKSQIFERQTIQFNDLSIGGVTAWSWNFAGGSPAISEQQNPQVTYDEPGSYDVSLAVVINGVSYENIRPGFINVAEPAGVPAVNFTADRAAIFSGQQVQFSDASHGSALAWNWTFEGGEPASSTDKNPNVRFNEKGTFGVSLRVENSKGTGERNRIGMIVVEDGPMLTSNVDDLNIELEVGQLIERTLTINNPGDQALTYNLSSTFARGVITFNDGENSGSLPAGASREIQLSLAAGPLFGGTYNGFIQIESNDPRNQITKFPVELKISGIPQAELSHTSVDFGETQKGDLRYSSIFILNSGTDTLRIGSELSSTAFRLPISTFKIPADSMLNLRVVFNPQSLGEHSADLILSTNDPENNQLVISLTGSAIPSPELELSVSSLDFTLEVGDSVTQKVTLRNVGGATLDYSISLENKIIEELNERSGNKLIQRADTVTVPANYSLNANYDGAQVLILQDYENWFLDIQRQILIPMGISSHKLNSQHIQNINFNDYDLLITVGEQSYYYYSNISAYKDKFRDFVEAGGNVLYLSPSDGSGITMAGNAVLNPDNYEYRNIVADHQHPIMEEMPEIIESQQYYYVSRGTLRSMPQNANILVRGVNLNQPTVAEYQLGAGKVLASGMEWEAGFYLGEPSGMFLPRAIEYLLNNSVRWLRSSSMSGTIEGGSEVELELSISAKYLLGGVYAADMVFSSNDPVNGTLSLPVSLEVTGVPELQISGNELEFGRVWVQQTKSANLLIDNKGTADLVITPTMEESVFEVSADPIIITAGKSAILGVQFSASEIGEFSTILHLSTNDPLNPELEIALSAIGVNPPILSYDPESLTIALHSGEQKTATILLENSGGDTLYYFLQGRSVNPIAERLSASSVDVKNYDEVILKKGEPDNRKGNPVTERSGNDGTNGFGYSWIDSREVNGPAYSWIEIGNIGKPLSLGDDQAKRVDLPFAFSFYGIEKNQVYISSNGYLSFNESGATSYSNSPLPYPNYPNDLIAALWTDLWAGDNVRYYGSDEYFIVQYTDVRRLGDSNSLTFQIILYPSGDIKIQYKKYLSSHSSGTIGIEDANGSRGLQIAYNTPFIESSLAVKISSFKGISFQPPAGKINPESTAEVQFNIDGSGFMGGVYNKEVVLKSNDPLRPESVIPVTLEVTGAPVIELSRHIVEFKDGIFTGGADNQKLNIRNTGSMQLDISSLRISSGSFSINTTATSLNPGENFDLWINFTSNELGEHNGILVIESNYPQNETMEVNLHATIYEPPVIEVSTTGVKGALSVSDDWKEFSFKIKNKGGYPLTVGFNGSAGTYSTQSQLIDRKVGFYASPQTTGEARIMPQVAERKERSNAQENIVIEVYPNSMSGVTGMCWVNGDLYYLRAQNGGLYKYDFNQRRGIFQFNVRSEAYGLTWDGEFLWVSTYSSAHAYSLAGHHSGSFDIPSHSGYNTSISWDGSAFIIAPLFNGEQIFAVNERGEVLANYSLANRRYYSEFVTNGIKAYAVDLENWKLVSLTRTNNQYVEVESFDYPFWSNCYALAFGQDGLLWAADDYQLYKLNTHILPHWILAEFSNLPLEVGIGEEHQFSFSMRALQSMPVGKHRADLQIHSNDPLHPTTLLQLELDLLNTPPTLIQAVDNMSMDLSWPEHWIELAGLFEDVNSNDELRFFASSSNLKVDANVSGNLLLLQAKEGGKATVKVFATDLNGGRSQDLLFDVTVIDKNNRNPRIVVGNTLPAMVQEGKQTEIDLKTIFIDPDGDPLSYKVVVDNKSIMHAEATGQTLRLNGLKSGQATITITASDGKGGVNEFSLKLGINSPPKAGKQVAQQIMAIDTDTLRLNLKELFSDADGDAMNFEIDIERKDLLGWFMEADELVFIVRKKGETRISLSAKDPNGGIGETGFSIIGHHAPVLKSPFGEQTLKLSEVRSINLFSYFTELDGESISFKVEYDESVLNADLKGTLLELKGLKVGESTMTIITTDARGASLRTNIIVNVVEVLSVHGGLSQEYKIYPNPFNNAINVLNESSGKYIISVFDPLGRLLKIITLDEGGSLNYSLDLSDLSQGNYLMELKSTDSIKVFKIFKN